MSTTELPRPKPGPARLGSAARKFASYAAAAAVHPLGDRRLHRMVAGRLEPADGHADRPVVLVHGWTARKTCWYQTIVRLGRAGFGDIHTASYALGDDIASAAAKVADRIVRVADDHGSDAVDVVAHSMGGLATLAAVVDLGLGPRLGRVVTLGTPYHGAPRADLARLAPGVGPLRAARQMTAGSDTLLRLRAEASARLDVPWTCLWSPADELVPAGSAVLHAPHVAAVETAPVGHVEMLMDRTVAAQVAAALAPAPSYPSARPAA